MQTNGYFTIINHDRTVFDIQNIQGNHSITSASLHYYTIGIALSVRFQFGDFQLWKFLTGTVCLLTGIMLAVMTVRLFYKLGNGTPAPWDPTTKMIVAGPYAYVRNPMITGVVLILAGEALMLSSLAIGIWAVVFMIINMLYLPLSEEAGLRKRFGKEYDEYCKNVPRYIPRLTPWKPETPVTNSRPYFSHISV